MHFFEIVVFIYYACSLFEARFKKWIFPVVFVLCYWLPIDSMMQHDWDNIGFRIPISMLLVVILVSIFFKDKFVKKFLYILAYMASALVFEMIFLVGALLFDIRLSELPNLNIVMFMMQLYYVPMELAFSVIVVKLSKRKFETPASTVIQNIVLFVLSQLFLYNMILQLYGFYHINSFAMISLIIISLSFSAVFGMLIFKSMAKMYKQQQQEQSLFEQSMYQAEKYETLKIAYMDYHRLRHDFYDHISILDSLKSNGNENELNNYITQMKEKFELLENVVFCENTAVDMLINNKSKIAAEKGIKTNFSLKDTVSCGIDNMDLCSIFSNLLNNAISGTENFDGEKYVIMQSYIKAGCFVITCKNSSNTPLIDLKTTKSNKDVHGFGIQIIKNISKKLDGNAVFEYKNNEFNSVVTIPIE